MSQTETKCNSATLDLRLSPLVLGISHNFLAGKTPRQKARLVRRAATTLLEIADEIEERGL